MRNKKMRVIERKRQWEGGRKTERERGRDTQLSENTEKS